MQRGASGFERLRTPVFAISYDPVEVLAAFAGEHGITYHLLSDEGSRVIRELGLLNEHVDAHHRFYGIEPKPHHRGTPYPGVFVLDEEGVVARKRFEQSYRVRPAPALLVEDVGGQSQLAGPAAEARGPYLAVRAGLDSESYNIWQKLRLVVEARLAEGTHVYGRPIPEGFVPFDVELEPLEGLVTEPLELPGPRPFRVQGLEEEFFVLERRFRGVLPFYLTQPLGDVELGLRVSYQACTEVECFPPAELRLTLPLGFRDLRRP